MGGRKENIKPREIQQALKLCSDFSAVHCGYARSEGNMIMFYPMVSIFCRIRLAFFTQPMVKTQIMLAGLVWFGFALSRN